MDDGGRWWCNVCYVAEAHLEMCNCRNERRTYLWWFNAGHEGWFQCLISETCGYIIQWIESMTRLDFFGCNHYQILLSFWVKLREVEETDRDEVYINYFWCWCVWYGIVRILFPLRHLFQLLSSKLWWNENNATKGKAFDEKDLLPEPSWYTNQHFAKAQRQEVQLRTKYCLD